MKKDKVSPELVFDINTAVDAEMMNINRPSPFHTEKIFCELLGRYLNDDSFREDVEKRAEWLRTQALDSIYQKESEEEYQPRYKAFLKTGMTVSNSNYMEFITVMKNLYSEKEGAVHFNADGSFSIIDQDDFTAFIEKEVEDGTH